MFSAAMLAPAAATTAATSSTLMMRNIELLLMDIRFDAGTENAQFNDSVDSTPTTGFNTRFPGESGNRHAAVQDQRVPRHVHSRGACQIARRLGHFVDVTEATERDAFAGQLEITRIGDLRRAAGRIGI